MEISDICWDTWLRKDFIFTDSYISHKTRDFSGWLIVSCSPAEVHKLDITTEVVIQHIKQTML